MKKRTKEIGTKIPTYGRYGAIQKMVVIAGIEVLRVPIVITFHSTQAEKTRAFVDFKRYR